MGDCKVTLFFIVKKNKKTITIKVILNNLP